MSTSKIASRLPYSARTINKKITEWEKATGKEIYSAMTNYL